MKLRVGHVDVKAGDILADKCLFHHMPKYYIKARGSKNIHLKFNIDGLRKEIFAHVIYSFAAE